MFIRYCAALIYDTLIVLVLFFVFTGFVVLIRHNQAIPPNTIGYQLSLLLIVLAYYATALQRGGQTIGLRAWRIQLVPQSGKQLSTKHILKRFIFFIPSLLIAPFYLKRPDYLLNQWTETYLTFNPR